jgi:hypothetical protein
LRILDIGIEYGRPRDNQRNVPAQRARNAVLSGGGLGARARTNVEGDINHIVERTMLAVAQGCARKCVFTAFVTLDDVVARLFELAACFVGRTHFTFENKNVETIGHCSAPFRVRE